MSQLKAEFEVVFDLEVEGKTLYDVEFTVNPDGTFRYRVPGCIRAPESPQTTPKYINQVTNKGITAVRNDAFIVALLKRAELES